MWIGNGEEMAWWRGGVGQFLTHDEDDDDSVVGVGIIIAGFLHQHHDSGPL